MNEMKEVLPLYIGQKVKLRDGSIGTLTGAYRKAVPNIDCNRVQVYHDEQINWLDADELTPILRPLDSISQSEAVDVVALRSDVYLDVGLRHSDEFCFTFNFRYKTTRRIREDRQDYRSLNAEQFVYLTRNGFDLFGLKEKGLALYESDLK